MKRSLLVIAVLAAFMFIGNGTQAVAPSVTERFTGPGSVQSGDSGVYNFDKAHSAISFRVRHMGLVDVIGFFRDFKGTINYDAADVRRSSVEFTAKATSVDTGIAPRDNHLRTADFFDVEKFPELTFKSSKVEKKGKKLRITGDLAMHGVTKTISFDFAIAGFVPGGDKSPTKMGVTAQTSLNRRDYGINYGNTLPNGVAALGDIVQIDLQIEANKAAAAATTQK